jgi:diacylglycerol kinase
MVCCALVAFILAIIAWPVSFLFSSPLKWRLSAQEQLPSAPTGSFLQKRIASFSYAFAGIGFVVRYEMHMRIHLIAAIIVILLGIYFRVSPADWRWLVVAIAMVVAAEAVNTAVEQTCNAISISYHSSIKAAKDIAAGAVLIVALAAAIIGASVFWPYMRKAAISDGGATLGSMCSAGLLNRAF